jgi:hypothetical protein
MKDSDIIGLKVLSLATQGSASRILFETPGITHNQNQASRGFLQQDLGSLPAASE